MFIQGYHIGIATFPGVLLTNKGIQKFKNRKGNKISENFNHRFYSIENHWEGWNGGSCLSYKAFIMKSIKTDNYWSIFVLLYFLEIF